MLGLTIGGLGCFCFVLLLSIINSSFADNVIIKYIEKPIEKIISLMPYIGM
jgi:hypothetical protein